mgnify:CR=1 FL=1
MIEKYFEAFNAKDLLTIRELFSPKVTLQDPVVGKVEGIEAVMAIYEKMFDGNEFELILNRQFQQGTFYAVEFSLKITNIEGAKSLIEGMDVIEIREDKIQSLRAYLDTSVLGA